MHWLCIATYAPVIAYNYATIANDYYFWQNASGEKHLWVGWALNPLFLSSWIFAPLHYWNSVAWSVSTQVGFYFVFPFVARVMKARLAKEEGGLAVSGNASGAVPAFPPLRFINKSGFLTRPKLNDYTVTREELLSRANDIYGWINSGDLKVAVRTVSRSRFYRAVSRASRMSMRQTSVAIVVTHARTPTLNSRSRHRGAPEASRDASRFRSPLAVAACPAFPLTPRVFSFRARAAGGPLLPPGASRGGPRLPRGGQVARQGSVRDLIGVFVEPFVTTATNAGIESASVAYQSDDHRTY